MQSAPEPAIAPKAGAPFNQKENAVIDRLISMVTEDIDRQHKTLATCLQSLENHLREQPLIVKRLGPIRMALDRAGAFKARLHAFSDQAAWHPQQIDSVAMLKTAASLLRTSLLSDATHLKFDCDSDLWRIEADPDQMLASLLHLAINARDAMPRGGTITLSARNIPANEAPSGLTGEFIAISVIDGGTGIATELLDQVFQPFFSTKASYGGAGLGLSQVKAMATHAGGEVKVSGNIGNGTTITLYLPRAEAQSEIAQNSDAPRTGILDILIAKEDEAEAEALKGLAEQAGYSVHTTTRTIEACAVIRKQHPRLVIIDTTLRGIVESISLGRYLRHVHPDLRIVMAGQACTGSDAELFPRLSDHPTTATLAAYLGQPNLADTALTGKMALSA